MRHYAIRHKLSEYIDRSVTAEEKWEIEQHLKTCTICSDALRELKKTVEHIRTVEEVEPPAWMAQRTMAKVRNEAEQKRGFFHRLFLPLHIKLPIQAVAILFLAITAFYVYRSIQPTARFEEISTEQFSTGKKAGLPAPKSLEPSPATNAKGEPGKEKDSSLPSKQLPQTPEYNALDMRQEYESPPPPVLKGKAMGPVPAPAKPAGQHAQAKKEAALDKRAAALHTAIPAMRQKQAEPEATVSRQVESKHESVAPEQDTKSLPDRIEERGNFEKVIIDRHPNGKPKLIVSYKIVNSHKIQIAEERFNKDGERHGIQKEYYDSGKVKTEAQYEHGKLGWYMEFYPDGVKRIGKSDYDWFWLKN
jgi:hypothetical protein